MIYLILLLGLILRSISLNQSLWLDEAINVLAVKNNSVWNLVTEYSKADFHPPGYFILLWLWTQIGGISEIWVRIPSVIAGVLTIYVAYLIGKRINSIKLGLITAFLLAVNPLHIYYSQEARMYSIAAFGVALNFLMFLRFLKNEKGSSLWYAATLPMIFLFDYLAYFIFPVHIFWIFLENKRLFKKWFLLIIPAVIFLILWSLIFIPQLLTGITASSSISGWKDVVGGADLKQALLVPVKFAIGRITYPDKIIYASLLIPVLGIVCLLFYRAFNNFSRDSRLKWGSLFLLTLLLPFLISFYLPVFSYFRFLYLVPFFCLILAMGILSFNKWKIFLGLMAGIFFISSFTYLSNPQFQREDWKGLNNLNGPLVIASDGVFAPLKYYEPACFKIPACGGYIVIPGLKNFPAKDDNDVYIPEIGTNHNRFYYSEYLVDITDPKRLLKKRIEEMGFKNTGIKNFHGVGFLYEYQR